MKAGPAPPGVRPLRCEGVTANGRQCGGYGAWALPEIPLCRHHDGDLPQWLRQLRQRRVDRWHLEAETLWARILTEEPMIHAP